MQNILAQFTEFETLLAGVAIGVLLASLVFLILRQRLVTQNAALHAQMREREAAFNRAGAELDARFKMTANEALQKSSEQFLQLAQEKLKAAQSDGAHDLEKRQKSIENLVKPVQEDLKAINKAMQNSEGIQKSLKEDLNTLNRETARLVGALRDPAARGKWGEYILEGLLDKSGLIKGVHYETQVTMQIEGSRQRPDAVINMQDGFKIIIDAKAPVNKFAERLSEDLSEADYDALLNDLARQVKSHVQELGKKGYWENIDSAAQGPDFTVLFLPSEHLYSLALRGDVEIVDYAAKNNIIIASPTLLMSLLRVVGVSWRQVELAKNATEISERGMDLYKRLLTFTDHLGKVGKGLQSAMKGYDSAIGSLERQVLPAARKFKDLQGNASNIAALPEFEHIEESPRLTTLTTEDEQEKKRA